uniref:glycosyltransferase n=1 Tax=Roseovarius sp. TaxID=1486281 RepID=UPI00356AB3FD
MVSIQEGEAQARRLRIAFLVPSFPETSNTFILSQITGLIERGHAIDIFALRRGAFRSTHADIGRYGLDSQMRHLLVPANRSLRAYSAATLLLTYGLRYPKIFSALDPLRLGGSAWGLTQIHTAASFIRAGAYDVLHCQFGTLGPAGERLIAIQRGRTKLVTSFRGSDLTCHLSVRPRYFKNLLRRGDLFMAVSQDFRERLLAYGIPNERVVVHRSGINLRRFVFFPRQVTQGAAELLFVGRLAEKKGLAYLLDAVSLLVGSGRDVRLTVVGEGELGPRMRARCHELGIADRVNFVGSATHEEVVS